MLPFPMHKPYDRKKAWVIIEERFGIARPISACPTRRDAINELRFHHLKGLEPPLWMEDVDEVCAVTEDGTEYTINEYSRDDPHD